jgi:hypothetical protein
MLRRCCMDAMDAGELSSPNPVSRLGRIGRSTRKQLEPDGHVDVPSAARLGPHSMRTSPGHKILTAPWPMAPPKISPHAAPLPPPTTVEIRTTSI